MTLGDRWGLWLPPALYGLLIVALSHMSRPPVPPSIPGDLLHYPEFAVLAFLLVRAFQGRRPGLPSPGAVMAALGATLAFGALDEVHQAFVPERMPDAVDWLRDAAGAGAGIVLWGLWRWMRR